MVVSFRRYTNLAATIHLLRSRSITLLDPATWDDKNDAHFMAEYKKRKNAKAVLALCFAEREETYHHWKVFSHGSDGVCIEFDKASLMAMFTGAPGIKIGCMKYRTIEKLRASDSLRIEDLPFLKRYPYRDEKEFRVIYVDLENEKEFRNYEIEIDWVRRITLSPWMPKSLESSVMDTLNGISGCRGIRVTRSTLISNDDWKQVADRMEPRPGDGMRGSQSGAKA